MTYRSLVYLFVLAATTLLSGCFSDETEDGDGVISVISIDTLALQTTYDIDKNETLTITPSVSQEGLEKDLSYTWEIDQEVYSTDLTLNYVGTRLGTYQGRLIVENEDGKAFYKFVINVNSPYEQGYAIISVDDDGNSMLSFMTTPRSDGAEAFFETTDVFATNNPDETFASNVADIVHCDESLILACKGGDTDDDPGTIYYLNDKTMIVETQLSTAEYPDFKPKAMGIPANGTTGQAYPIVSEDGKVYEFSTSEGALDQARLLKYTYSTRIAVYTGTSSSRFSTYLWDKDAGGLCVLYNGYGPYYCSTTYLLERANLSSTTNYFNGLDFVTMVLPREVSSSNPELVVITKAGSVYQKVRLLGSFFWAYSYDQAASVISDNGGLSVASIGALDFDEDTPIIGSGKYLSILFANGNSVYKWNYTTNQRISAAPVYVTVGSDEAVITSMELSEDQEELFIAFYEPSESGLCGHVWVVGTDSGELLRKYDNVSYRPVKIIYKEK